MLDGAWGTLVHGSGLGPGDYRGERFAAHDRDVTGDPDILNLTRPGFVASTHERYLAAGADITTTNTFTATSIGQADYGLETVRLRDERGRRADRAGGRGRPLRRGLGRAAQRHALAEPEGRRPGLPHAHVRPGQGGLRGADGGARRGRRRPAAARDDLRHAEREGRDRRGARDGSGAAALDLGDDRRPLRPHALRPDDRGVLGLGRARRPADRRRQLLARRARDALVRRRPRARRAVPASARTRTPGCRTRSAATTRRPR